MGPASGQAPAPGRRPHRRRVGCDPAHRSETPCPRPRDGDARAGRRARSLRPRPGCRAIGRGVAAQRGGGADLRRRAALGRRQRPHHRDSLQDRRRSSGRRGGHHPRRHAGLGRHPAGGGWWRGEGVRAVGVADRPPGEGHCQSRGAWPIGSSSAATADGWAWPDAWPRTARPPTRSSARAAGSRVAAWSAATPAARLQVRRCGTYNADTYRYHHRLAIRRGEPCQKTSPRLGRLLPIAFQFC